jgi:SHAQKYF class myb-like DNA-binding protein
MDAAALPSPLHVPLPLPLTPPSILPKHVPFAQEDNETVRKQARLDADAHARVFGAAPETAPSSEKRSGKWGASEHQLFLEGLASFGKDWKKIASKVRTRTLTQIRTHAQKYFLKLDKARALGEAGPGTPHRMTPMKFAKAHGAEGSSKKKKKKMTRSLNSPRNHGLAVARLNLGANAASAFLPSTRDHWGDGTGELSEMNLSIGATSLLPPRLTPSSSCGSVRSGRSNDGDEMLSWPTDGPREAVRKARASGPAAAGRSPRRYRRETAHPLAFETSRTAHSGATKTQRVMQSLEEQVGRLRKGSNLRFDPRGDAASAEQMAVEATAAMKMLGMTVEVPLDELECNGTDDNSLSALSDDGVVLDDDSRKRRRRDGGAESPIDVSCDMSHMEGTASSTDCSRSSSRSGNGSDFDGPGKESRKRRRRSRGSSFVDECIEQLMQHAQGREELFIDPGLWTVDFDARRGGISNS